MRVRPQIFLCILLLGAAASWCEPVSQLHPSNYVNDFAQVLRATTIDGLNDTCRQLEEKAKAQVAVVTINSTDGKDIFDYSVELYQAWGIGSKATNRGVLILFAIKDHKYWTTVGYGLEPILPDGKVGGYGREAVPLLRASDYDGAVKLVTLRVADVIARDANIELTGIRPPPRAQAEPSLPPLAVIILALLFLGAPAALMLWLQLRGGFRGYRGGWGSGTWGGGGWGGGGFGGGSTGGGGAGGGW